MREQKELVLSPLGHTWILDLDGTIVRHNGYKTDGKDTFLKGAKEFLDTIPQGDMIIFLTSRTSKEKEATERFLSENHVRYDHILYNAPYGERILMNDRKPSGLNMALALSVERDVFEERKLVIDSGGPEVAEDMEQAAKGRQVWLGLKETVQYTSDDCLIIFGATDRRLMEPAFDYIPEYLRKKCFSRGILLISRDNGDFPETDEEIIVKVRLDADDIEALLKYYRLCQFAENIVVVSLEEPYGNDHLLGYKGISLDDYIKNAIFS